MQLWGIIEDISKFSNFVASEGNMHSHIIDSIAQVSKHIGISRYKNVT